MAFVTSKRWEKKVWTTDIGPRGSRHALWGVPAAVAIHEETEVQRESDPDGDDRALIGAGKAGQHYDLKGGDRLVWRAVDKADQEHPLAPWEPTPGELDHLAEGGARLSCLRLSRVPDEPLWKHRLTLPADCVLAYQPPLTRQEVEEGCIRPDAVVGSYAVFDASGAKIAHVLRPCAWSADRTRRVWGEISIVGGLSLVRFDRKALADLGAGLVLYGLDTFGYTSVGASTYTSNANGQDGAGEFTPASDGSATAVYAYIGTNYIAGRTITCGVWDSVSTKPRYLQRDTAGIAVSTAGSPSWHSGSLDSALSVVAGTSYWLGFNKSAALTFHWDSAAPGKLAQQGSMTYVEGTLADFGASPVMYSNRNHSIYAEYTPAASGPSPAVLHHYYSKILRVR